MTTHPLLSPLAGLVGRWSGRGEGSYPTIDPFEYEETLSFTDSGRPFLAYSQRTSDPLDQRPLHTEVGYLRVPAPGRAELVVAQATGIVEVCEGTTAGGRIDLVSTVVAKTSTALGVTAVERHLAFGADLLSYEVLVAMAGQPLTRHLVAELRREG